MSIINIVAGGPKDLHPSYHNYHSEDAIWVGVDRGVLYLLEDNIIPNKAVGDFDSIDENERKKVEKKSKDISVFPAIKDKTDTEIALEWALNHHSQVDKIHIFGVTGGRLDHFLGSLQLLLHPLKEGVQTKIIDRNNQIELYNPGVYQLAKDKHAYVSFLPVLKDIKGLTLSGFKYPLNNCHIHYGSTLCISNELINPIGTFSFESGILMVIKSKDQCE
ncbi:thiamine diphosphokinase [Bacillus carboniphilus]|uniref:Thiamine diphosphokinase n=1 Tax=Bacillus carboniphilus TaxID=86663 RepID=A0ABY9JVZ3_9BACI|nr:thiamine diphosphokinase [Bacillus carboniphilus]WLR43572.1 thiamine diphosphokinase [Bacillus carboniphilus]